MFMGKEKAVIFDIQKFSVHDGPGIRTLVFFKGCLLRCLWCCNPESQLKEPQLVFYPERCIRANKCWQVCPTHAISVEGNRLILDKTACNLCGKCVEACYAGAWKIFGMEVDVDYVMKEIEKDIPFYRNSGGGVTFGGGEPLLYPDFVNAVAGCCQEEGIHTAIETCGYAPWKNFEKALDNIDLVMFDIKHIDPQRHKELCGRSNKLIRDNLKQLSRRGGVEVVVRLPVIPGLNDSEENLKDTAEFVASLDGNIKRIELLPYHRFGEKKYERLGREYVLAGLQIPDEEHMQHLKGLMEGYGVAIKVGG
jgi:pyruvate formate lyase activating enzyme